MGGVTSIFDNRRQDGLPTIVIPEDYVPPDFPGLYLPTLSATTGQTGIFLYEAETIWHFTLYWTLVLLGSTFLLCSLLATFTLLLSLTLYRPTRVVGSQAIPTLPLESPHNDNNSIPLRSFPFSAPKKKRTRAKRKRPPLWPIFLIPVIAAFIGALVALITGTVVGFALAAVYSAGGFSMSTWVPFLWSLITVLVLIISSYSTLTSIL